MSMAVTAGRARRPGGHRPGRPGLADDHRRRRQTATRTAQIRPAGNGVVLVRDSADRGGQNLAIPAVAWTALTVSRRQARSHNPIGAGGRQSAIPEREWTVLMAGSRHTHRGARTKRFPRAGRGLTHRVRPTGRSHITALQTARGSPLAGRYPSWPGSVAATDSVSGTSLRSGRFGT
jgi:hypothetical protein